MENDDNELNITSIQELLKTVPDPYGGLEVEYTKPEPKINNKIAACVELIGKFGFDPFKYAADNNLDIHTHNSVCINLKNKINKPNDIYRVYYGEDQSLYCNEDQVEETENNYIDDDITDSLPNLTLVVETKKILDDLASEKAKKEYFKLITDNNEKSLEVINNGGKSAFRKSTEPTEPKETND